MMFNYLTNLNLQSFQLMTFHLYRNPYLKILSNQMMSLKEIYIQIIYERPKYIPEIIVGTICNRKKIWIYEVEDYPNLTPHDRDFYSETIKQKNDPFCLKKEIFSEISTKLNHKAEDSIQYSNLQWVSRVFNYQIIFGKMLNGTVQKPSNFHTINCKMAMICLMSYPCYKECIFKTRMLGYYESDHERIEDWLHRNSAVFFAEYDFF